ncbi:TIGR03084 family metal-binding protein [Streptomyces amakusaensis]|uniref:TIGR03084 family metal-binding protein n=1 Tax=Streptomyces amakusaensis TaxID=67271 RepID=A0ABW0A8X8_9ACTN
MTDSPNTEHRPPHPAPALDALAEECARLDALVAQVEAGQLATDSPAPGWTVADQIAHLVFVFGLARVAATDANAFHGFIERAAGNFNGAVNAALADYADDSRETLIARWREAWRATHTALAALPPERPVPWLTGPTLPADVARVGVLELFGHGQDIADALRLRHRPTDHIVHVTRFAQANRDFGYQARGLTPPSEPFRFELTGPSGALWEYGPADAKERITGSAYDFCLLVTRRRHRADLELNASGAEADRYLDLAQAYRGNPGPGRTPGQFAHLG